MHATVAGPMAYCKRPTYSRRLHLPTSHAIMPAMATRAKQPFLVLVHPGSACGSANLHLGRLEARAARDRLASDLRAWTGPVLVIDGEFSDELGSFPMFQDAIDGCLARSRAAGHFAARVMGDDPDHELRAKELCAIKFEYVPVFEVTGAWHMPNAGGGCVGTTVQVLREHGFEAAVADSALDPDEGQDDGEAAAQLETLR